MKLVLRSDLGGRAVGLPAAEALAGVTIRKRVVFLAGGNGAGKSSMIAALRRTTGLIGPGIGRFPKMEGNDVPVPFSGPCASRSAKVDLARHAFMVQDGMRRWERNIETRVPEGAVGVLDPVKLGWTGQRIWLHDGRKIDAMDGIREDFDLVSMRRAADDRVRSHGEQMTGRLRYAVAWAIGLFDIADPYDAPEPDKNDGRRRNEVVPREIFARLAGHRPDDPWRTNERWLLLDEPETGIDPAVFMTMMAILSEAAAPGRLRVVCASHSTLVFDIARNCGAQIVDIDGYQRRLVEARRMLVDPDARKDAVADETYRLRTDCAKAVSSDRGLRGQGRFTAHEAESVPYAEAIVAPYGKEECLERMACSPKPR